MLYRITGRATKCGPSAISAIAGVPTREPSPASFATARFGRENAA